MPFLIKLLNQEQNLEHISKLSPYIKTLEKTDSQGKVKLRNYSEEAVTIFRTGI